MGIFAIGRAGGCWGGVLILGEEVLWLFGLSWGGQERVQETKKAKGHGGWRFGMVSSSVVSPKCLGGGLQGPSSMAFCLSSPVKLQIPTTYRAFGLGSLYSSEDPNPSNHGC